MVAVDDLQWLDRASAAAGLDTRLPIRRQHPQAIRVGQTSRARNGPHYSPASNCASVIREPWLMEMAYSARDVQASRRRRREPVASAKQQSTTTKRSISKRGSSKRATSRRSATAAVAATTAAAGELACPECGKTFTRPASLGAHRNRAHGVAGSSKPAGTRRKTAIRTTKRGASTRKTATTPRTSKVSGTSAPSVSGASGRRRVRRSSDGHSPAVDRDSLLQSLFPTGIPARGDAIREVNAWLDEAERLARMR